jgi:sec-independent protein translocase protein TatB
VSNLGSGEILVILVLALIVLGPERLPEAARKIGGVVRQVRQLSNGFQQEVKRAMDFTDGDKPFHPEEARIRPLPDRTGDDEPGEPYETDVRAVHPEPFSASSAPAEADTDRPDDQRAAG